jgi:hypothetical protein
VTGDARCHQSGYRACLTGRVRRSAVTASVAGAVAAVVSMAALTACSSSSRGQDAFCQRLTRDRDALVTGVVDAKTAETAAQQYVALDGIAPEAIRVEWHQLTQLVQNAAKLDPGSADARRALVQQAYDSASAAATVTQYAKSTCGVDLTAPVTAPPTTAPPTTAAPAPAPTTAAPAAPTTAPSAAPPASGG